MTNGKIHEVLRKNAHWIIISLGVLVGVTACVHFNKGNTELVIKNNKITTSKTK